MNVNSSATDLSTFCATLEALNSSADRFKIMQTHCTESSNRYTQICTPDFRQQLCSNGMSKFSFNDMPSVADALNFM